MSKTLQTLSESESDALLLALVKPTANTKAYTKTLRDTAIVLLMLDAGLRVGEVTKLRQSHLVHNNQIVTNLSVTAAIAKGGRERYVPLTARLREALNKARLWIWNKNQDTLNGFAFYYKNCAFGLVPRQVQRIVKKAAGISINREIHPHVLRHTFATRLMRTTNIRIVQELLGHKQLTSTQIYTHPHMTDLADAIETLNGGK